MLMPERWKYRDFTFLEMKQRDTGEELSPTLA